MLTDVDISTFRYLDLDISTFHASHAADFFFVVTAQRNYLFCIPSGFIDFFIGQFFSIKKPTVSTEN